MAQTQGTAVTAAAAVGIHSLRARESENGVPLEHRRDLLLLASCVLVCVRYAQTAQLVVAAALLHRQWANAAGQSSPSYQKMCVPIATLKAEAKV